jgi:hypothetical protein
MTHCGTGDKGCVELVNMQNDVTEFKKACDMKRKICEDAKKDQLGNKRAWCIALIGAALIIAASLFTAWSRAGEVPDIKKDATKNEIRLTTVEIEMVNLKKIVTDQTLEQTKLAERTDRRYEEQNKILMEILGRLPAKK